MVDLIDGLLDVFEGELWLNFDVATEMQDVIAILNDEVGLARLMGMEGPAGAGSIARGGKDILVIAIDSGGTRWVIR